MNQEKLVYLEKKIEHEGFTYSFGIKADENLNLYLYSNVKKDDNFLGYKEYYEDSKKAFEVFNNIINKKDFDAMVIFATRMADINHAGQKDLGGKPYIYHLLSVRNSFDDPYLRTIGVLHDIVEDTSIDINYLFKFFPKIVVEAIDAISRRKIKNEKESEQSYYARIKENDLAVQVKIQDLINNSILSRLNKVVPSLTDAERQVKYANHIYELINYLINKPLKA